MSRTTEHVGHWEDLETWLSVATDSLLPKAAETLKHQTQEQLDDNITSLMEQDPSQSYSHKELAKITGSLSHTLIATLKLSDRHAAHLQQELTRVQWCIEQPSSFGNSTGKSSWESNENSKGKSQTHPGATSPRNRRKNLQRFQADRAQTESTQEQKTPPCFDSLRADENDDERVIPTKVGRSEVGKERETRFSLTSSRTRRQRPADPTSHREQHSFTSLSENRNHPNFRWTRNPT